MSTDSTPEEESVGLDSESAESVEEAVGPDVQDEDANAADSSTANDQDANEEPESLFDAVTAAIEQDQVEETSSDSESVSEDSEPPAEAGDDDPPFHEHPRWQEMISERDAYKQSHEELLGLKNYMTEHGLTSDEVTLGFDIMKNIKHNPQAALEALAPFIQEMEVQTGVRLSPDIQERFDEGYIDEESARELSQSRSREQLAQQASQRAAAQAQQIQQQQQLDAHANEVSGAVSEWERGWSSNDPDYKLKQPKVMEKIELHLLKNGAPQTKEDAVQIAEACRKAVDNEFRQLRPQKGNVTPVTGGSSPKSTPEPQTLMEAMQQGLAAAS
jgi:hypothetical protein|tara:strand:- start:7917 stop:8906 length:990 start_codon:yes stop_codon:yes gene_type:complete